MVEEKGGDAMDPENILEVRNLRQYFPIKRGCSRRPSPM